MSDAAGGYPAASEPTPTPAGLTCPGCGAASKVAYVRARKVPGVLYRGRDCTSPACGRRFVTAERVVGRAADDEPAIPVTLVAHHVTMMARSLGLDVPAVTAGGTNG